MKREKRSRDVLKAALYIVRGQPRRERRYRDAVEEILGAGGAQYAEYTMRGGEKARAYLPGAKGKTGNPTASKVEAIDALERLGYVKTMRRVQEAYETIGGDLPEKMRQDLQRAISLNCADGKRYTYERLNVGGIGRSDFYARRATFLYDVAAKCGLE